MDSDDMNTTAKSAQHIKGFTAVNIAEDKTTRIRRVLGIGLNDFAFGNNVLNFRQGNAAGVTPSLAMTRDLKCPAVNFLTDSFNHVTISNLKFNRGLWLCQCGNRFNGVDV